MAIVAFGAHGRVRVHGVGHDALVLKVSLRDFANVLDLSQCCRLAAVEGDPIQVVANLTLQLMLDGLNLLDTQVLLARGVPSVGILFDLFMISTA